MSEQMLTQAVHAPGLKRVRQMSSTRTNLRIPVWEKGKFDKVSVGSKQRRASTIALINTHLSQK